jgi:hypothetical protein
MVQLEFSIIFSCQMECFSCKINDFCCLEMKEITRWMLQPLQLEFSSIFHAKWNIFFWKINGFCCLEMKENMRCMFSLCLKNLLSANYDVGQNVPSVKNFVGLNCRRWKIPSVKIAVGQNCCRSKDLEPFSWPKNGFIVFRRYDLDEKVFTNLEWNFLNKISNLNFGLALYGK